jgi:6-pyruvoyltetrahydropterin/6-carboxytetrahydropterin synthase
MPRSVALHVFPSSMPVSVSKTFRFEAAHRLPWYEGLCKHIHGHSYALTVELTGEPDANGMVADFKDIKRLVAPLIDQWDHALIISVEDQELLDIAESLDSRYALLPFDSTAENLAAYTSEFILTEGGEFLRNHRISAISVSVRETETCEARIHRSVDPG